ncbi:dihydrodipicolinate synthase family protein [Streptomyces sp. NPDC054796]
MTRQTSPHGIHVPLITPFTSEGAVAEHALEALAHAALDEGATGIVALGTTAEAATLAPWERTAVVDVCARVCRERSAPLTVGAGGNDTRSSAEALAELARWREVTAALVTVPSFTRPSQAGVVAHFSRLARHSPVPLIVYHVPYRTGLPLDAATLRELGRLPGVSGVKLAQGGIDHGVMDLLGDLPDGFAVLVGDDPFLSPLLALGAAGGIVASAHVATGRFAELVTAWSDGDVVRARHLGHSLVPLSEALFAEPNPTVIKGVLHQQGRIPTPDVRLPLLPAGAESVDEAMKRAAELGGL